MIVSVWNYFLIFKELLQGQRENFIEYFGPYIPSYTPQILYPFEFIEYQKEKNANGCNYISFDLYLKLKKFKAFCALIQDPPRKSRIENPRSDNEIEKDYFETRNNVENID